MLQPTKILVKNFIVRIYYIIANSHSLSFDLHTGLYSKQNIVVIEYLSDTDRTRTKIPHIPNFSRHNAETSSNLIKIHSSPKRYVELWYCHCIEGVLSFIPGIELYYRKGPQELQPIRPVPRNLTIVEIFIQ